MIEDGLTKDLREKTIREFEENLLSNQKDIPPEFAKLINEHFWDLVGETNGV